MVMKIDYTKAFLITLVLAVIGIAGVKMLDDAKLASLSNDVKSATDELESTRLLLLYSQTFQNANDTDFCNALEYTTEQQMDKGANFITRLKQLEDANLFSDYRETRQEYFLSNVELWLYITQAKEKCGSQGVTSILFFHEADSYCSDCIVQGQILDDIRAQCGNVRVITLATDLNMNMVELIKKRYNVTSAPALVFDDGTVLKGLQKEQTIMDRIDCRKTEDENGTEITLPQNGTFGNGTETNGTAGTVSAKINGS